jgi:hypothetical protein
MSDPRWTCFVCGKPVSDGTVHFCHREGCDKNGCDCDFPCHPGCCPECNQIDKRGKDNE